MDADIPSLVKDGKERVLFFLSHLVPSLRGSCKRTGDGKPQETVQETVQGEEMHFSGVRRFSFGRNKKPQEDKPRASSAIK